jgi:hypothetical protein
LWERPHRYRPGIRIRKIAYNKLKAKSLTVVKMVQREMENVSDDEKYNE